MEKDIFRFYYQWKSLSRRIAAQGNMRAMEVCSRDHTAECTVEKRSELTNCITKESETIHDQMVVIYDQRLRKPWESEFQKLKEILEHPECHSKDTVDETIWTVSTDNLNEDSVRFRFYNSLVNFQSPPELYPIDKVYQLCLDRLFTK
uniref:ATP-dependent helicase ULS1 n=1 Tax=Lygus hesperus TaxID=30085 RepID=A0A0A9WRD4_LYGHE